MEGIGGRVHELSEELGIREGGGSRPVDLQSRSAVDNHCGGDGEGEEV